MAKKGYTPEQIINKLREAKLTNPLPRQNDEYIRLSTKSIKSREGIGLEDISSRKCEIYYADASRI